MDCHLYRQNERQARQIFIRLAEELEYSHEIAQESNQAIQLGLLKLDSCRTRILDLKNMIELPKSSTEAEQLRKLSPKTLFSAPEMFDDSDYPGVYDPKAADVWAVGVYLYEKVFGEMPFESAAEIQGARRPACPKDTTVS